MSHQFDHKTKIISELDFETLRSNIAAFIANNSNFTDYNFEGSGLSLLMEILAYNTHYNAVYLNMALNENFMDTAQLRSSVVSIAKNLGYTPRSKKSATTVVSLSIPTTDASNTALTLNKNVKFVGEKDGSSFIFQPIQAYTALSDGSQYKFNSVFLKEGTKITIQYVVTGSSNEKFFINNFNIDTSSIEVLVEENSTNNQTDTTAYNLISDITVLDPTSTIFYLFESTNRNYIIQFGDGILGRKPLAGSTVSITFQTSSGELANDITSLSLLTPLSVSIPTSSVIFNNIVASYGGAGEEEINSIRINALNQYSTQGRAVTAEDYKFFLERDYPQAESISVWGGQDNDPPIYGKVFISFKPKKGFYLTNSVKQEILTNIIKNKNVVTIIPEIVDPEYTFLLINTIAVFDPRSTLLSSAEIESKIRDGISEYNTSTLTKFGTRFNYSKFLYMIDQTEDSIVSNYTTIRLRKNIPVYVNNTNTYIINFQNKIKEGSFKSGSSFKAATDSTLGLSSTDFYIEDNSKGILVIYKFSEGTKVVMKNSGTIDYELGIVRLVNFKPSQTINADETLDFICETQDYDIVTQRNNILTIIDSDVSINMKVE
jgi:hypothetical protein